MRTLLLTLFALVAFAANSVLCRLALGTDSIDPTSFTSIRLISGAIVLFTILIITKKTPKLLSNKNWFSSGMLFLYAAAFSFAYLTLDTGTGALILFGAVQITIIAHSIFSKNKLNTLEWLGIALSFFGFVYLILPGVSAPPIEGFILMTTSGIAWGVYTIKGYNSKVPLMDTSINFIMALPFVALLLILTLKNLHLTNQGILLAIFSGGITSGVGYAIWYMAIKGLTSTQTAVVQLTVPALAAFGGVLFMSEVITIRLVIASILILGGVLLVTLFKKR